MADRVHAPDPAPVTFETRPDLLQALAAVDSTVPIATLSMDVQEDAGLSSDYRLKLNSYDLGVDIELADAIQRIRFEHPEVRAVVITSLKERIFCAGANIMMLRESSHGLKVNFCKFTNETRLAIEDASAALRHQVPRRAERHLRRRRLRAGAGVRRDHPRRRRQLGGEPAGGAAARRAARHRRPDAPRRQAAGAPRPRRLLQHARRRREGQARGRVAARGRGPSDQPVQGGGRGRAPRALAAAVGSAGRAAPGITLEPLEPDGDRGGASPIPRCR